LPVVYAAVGRRLGYPIKLVSARGRRFNHGFARWDDSNGERLNLEVNHTGLSCPPEDYYREGRFEGDREQEEAGCFLRSMTPRMEMASFLADRAICWQDAGRMRACVDAWAWASGLAPENRLYLNTLKGR